MTCFSVQVKQAGGITELHRLFNELPGLYKRNEEIIDEVRRVETSGLEVSPSTQVAGGAS